MQPDVRTRILEGTYECVARQGIGQTSLEDAARAAGVSRATLYRHFPGGRDQLMGEVIAWETIRFFGRLADSVASAPDIETILVDALMFGHRAIEEHAVLQKILDAEPGLLLPRLTVETSRLVELIRAYLVARFAGPGLPGGLAADDTADYMARMLLSFRGAPGRWDLADREQVVTLVRSELVAGVAEARFTTE